MNSFGADRMAAGYARCRPPVHPHVLAQVRPHLGSATHRALDVGCGAGLSTRALLGIADRCVGLDPSHAMIRQAMALTPDANFVVGSAEAIPLANDTVDLITAAGSLNYVDLPPFFREASRVLSPDGVLVVYDFSPGKSFADGTGLEKWFAEFQQRFPPPQNEGQDLNPAILAQMNSGFRLRSHQPVKIALTLSPDFYLDYMLTETNVAEAIRNGVPDSDIRAWCEQTLQPVWRKTDHTVLFHGYFACMSRP